MIKAAILTVSDSCAKGLRKDASGAAIKKIIRKRLKAELIGCDIVADEKNLIKEKLIYYADKIGADLVLTCGGTGFSARDVTPEATKEAIDREAPGIAELMRRQGARKTARAALSRAVCGLRAKTLIINLPGSVKGAADSLGAVLGILPHAFDMMEGKSH